VINSRDAPILFSETTITVARTATIERQTSGLGRELTCRMLHPIAALRLNPVAGSV
jgi:hypothetical protein